MNKHPFTMGQTDNEDFATASTATQPVNFANQEFNPDKALASQQSPVKQRSPCREQSGRPSTPFPENDVQFLPTYNNMVPDQPLGDHNDPSNVNSTFSAPGAMAVSLPLNQANLHFSGTSSDALHHAQQAGPMFFSQQQSWPPESHKLYYSQSLDLENTGIHRTNPFASGQRSASCDASQGSTTPTSPVEREERIPNSVRRSRVWKYGRRSSGNHSDRQPFTFSVSASQAGGAIGGIDQSGARFFGKRSISNTRNDESWSTEPITKQFISEERMTAEMHNLSLDGVHRQPVLPLPSSSSTTSSSSTSTSPSSSSAPNPNLPSTSGHCSHGNSSDLLRHHQCQHHPRSRSYAEVVLANIERRLDDDSDDEGVEEDMPPNQGDHHHRLEMTPQLVSALKATKATSGHVLPQDIVKKIVASPCMELVLWRPLSIMNPRLGPESSSSPSSPSSSGSELAPIMEVEVERERAEAGSMVRQPQPYDGIPASDCMQEEALPDYDEDMDL